MNAQVDQVQRETTVAALRDAAKLPEARLPLVRAGFNDSQAFALLQRAGNALAASTLVPSQFQGNLPNCIIALEMAQRIGASPLMVAQNLYVVHGRPSWSAKFLIATFNQCGRFSAIRYEWQGERGSDEWGCRAWAIEKENGQRITGALITIALAKKEGWYGKSGSKWQTIPEQMLMYRAAAWLVNTHAPEISMGLNTEDEMRDVYDARQAADGSFQVDTAALAEGKPAEPVTVEPEAEAKDAPPAEPDPDAKPEGAIYSVSEAIAAVKEAKSLRALKSLRESIFSDFEDSGRAVPLAVEAAMNDRQAALEG